MKEHYIHIFIFILLWCIPPIIHSATLQKVQVNNTGLVGRWSFDGSDINWTANTTTDSSGNGNTGTLVNMSTTTSPTTGKVGQALSFDGSNDSVNLGRVSATESASQLTWSFWAYTNVWQDGDGFISKEVPYNNGSWHIGISSSCNVGNQLIVYIATTDGDGGTLGCADVSSATGRWIHYVVVFDGTQTGNANRLKIYVDGVQDSVLDFIGTIPASTIVSANNVRIGSDSAGNANLSGKIDDVRIYNRALSSTEVLQLYRQGQATTNKSLTNRLTSGLAGYWTMDGGDVSWSTNTIVDKSGLGRTGTLKNMATSTVPTIGKIGQAFKFDGVNDFITMGDVNAVDSLTAITVAAWVKVGSDATERHIVDKSLCDGAINGGPFELYMVSHKAVFAMYPVTGTPANFVNTSQSVSAIDDNQWHFLVGRYDGSNIELWIDGVRDPGYQGYSSLTMSNSTNELQIGGDCSGVGIGNGYEWPGLIDEVRVYTRAITPAEIKQLYNMGQVKLNTSQSGRVTSGLVGYWSFNGPDISWSTNTAYDRSGQGNNGTITNMSTSSSPAIGKVGQALKFTSSSDKVDVGNITATNSQSQMTWSFWLYQTSYQNGAYYLSKDNPNAGTQESWSIFNENTSWQGTQDDIGVRVSSSLTSNLDLCIAQDADITLNQWMFVTVVFDGTQTGNTNRIKIYTNGVQRTLTAGDCNGTIPSSTTNSTSNVVIGDSADASRNIDGVTMDEVRIYNRALSASEIKQLYNMGR